MRITARNGSFRTAIIITASLTAGMATLPGCGGQGKHTAEQSSLAQLRMLQMKSATEWDLSRQAYLSGDLEKALEKINYSISLNGEVPKSHVLRGRILLEQGSMGDAISAFETAETLDPENVDSQYFQGIVYERILRREQALVHYQKAAKLDDTNTQYVIAVAEVMVDLDRVAEADEFLANLGTNFDHSPGVRQTRGHLSLILKDPEAAYEFFREARLLAPDDSAIEEDLARTQMTIGKFAEAENGFFELLSDKKNAERRDLKHLRAECLLQVDRPMEAREILLDLTSGNLGAGDVDAWASLGEVAYRLRDMQRVRRAGSRLQAIAPSRHEGYLFQALWHRHAGRNAAAIRSTTKALKRKPDDFTSLTVRGMALIDLGKLDSAEKTFRYTLAAYPGNKMVAKALAGVRNQISQNDAIASVEEPKD